ncbi:GNAT family N-acetyltransferase [Nocardia huaxiensis]|uniref:N-acetyltransferase n=1 Tax=Nocardia huaxiensis TaxID=2755382 RepID=A0A7D6VBA1_9NOCA|nr:GNAT family N-acetyltransferase [Nocardia huaxiensis]QLY30162.1 N-acetyltransferase [Nocardia huaxiensis]UFS96224.1 N-acetyltransferase [Nocardia huaxiensis]
MSETGKAAAQFETTVTRVTEARPEHYAITFDGERAGLTAYVDQGPDRIFFHTEVDDRFAGHGLGSTLIRAALEDTRAAGLRIVPICPFVAAYVKKHHDFDDLLDPISPAAIAAVEALQG